MWMLRGKWRRGAYRRNEIIVRSWKKVQRMIEVSFEEFVGLGWIWAEAFHREQGLGCLEFVLNH